MAHFMAAAIAAAKLLERLCPKCHRQQIVPLSKRTITVACKFCGAEIPPKQQ